MKRIFVTATGTEVGKTFVSSGIITALLAKGVHACYYKPVESGGIASGNGCVSGECAYIQAYNSCVNTYNTYCFENAMSPHLASRLEGQKIDPSLIKEQYLRLLEKYEFVLVEGAGGLSVPLMEYDYMIHDLIKDLDTEVIIVADAGLGAINHTTLTVAMAKQQGIKICGIVLNRYTGSAIQKENIRAIETLTQIPVLAVIPEIDSNNKEAVRNYFVHRFPIDQIWRK